jgi:hypothetical protein
VTLQKKNDNENYSDYIGIASRDEIISSLNTTLKIYTNNSNNSNNTIFEKNSKIEKIDETYYSYYKITIILNRYLVKYKQNMNICIEFPNETRSDCRIWTFDNVNYNCFFFDNKIIRFCNSELPEATSVTETLAKNTSDIIV